jgi:hypothetical protein
MPCAAFMCVGEESDGEVVQLSGTGLRQKSAEIPYVVEARICIIIPLHCDVAACITDRVPQLRSSAAFVGLQLHRAGDQMSPRASEGATDAPTSRYHHASALRHRNSCRIVQECHSPLPHGAVSALCVASL